MTGVIWNKSSATRQGVSILEQKFDLDALASFDLVARHGGFSRATAATGRSKATLSRQVQALEAHLGVRLIDRDGRALALTEEGRLLHDRTRDNLSEIASAIADLSHDLGPPNGRLRISCPTVFGHQVMGQIAADFARAVPSLELDISIDDRMVDLIDEGYDVVIRVNPRADSRLVGRCLLRNDVHLIAAPDLQRPADPDLPVPLVTRTRSRKPDRLTLHTGDRQTTLLVRSALVLPTLLMLRDAVMAGGFAATLPRWLVHRELAEGTLCDWGRLSVAPDEVWVLHASRRLTSRKVKLFVDFLTSQDFLTPQPAGPNQRR